MTDEQRQAAINEGRRILDSNPRADLMAGDLADLMEQGLFDAIERAYLLGLARGKRLGERAAAARSGKNGAKAAAPEKIGA